MKRMSKSLRNYVTLGRSGLRVSPLCLGAGGFAAGCAGTDEDASRANFDRYTGEGGNFFDTADNYTNGKSEEMLGKFVHERRLRNGVVIATKFTGNADSDNPNAGGNGRKNIYRALESSLRRLKTDYVDLYWLHFWDMVTPVEEVISTLNDLVREGRVRHYGLSNAPAWYVARAQTLAEKEGKERLIALQLEYSLVERNIEREHVPAAQELGIAICPWSPLAFGFLSGKYKQERDTWRGEGRLETFKNSDNPFLKRFTPHHWSILEVLLDVAKRVNKTPAQVALSWVATQPGITSTIIGATNLTQLNENLAALEFEVPADLRKRLDEVSALEPVNPYQLFRKAFQAEIAGGVSVRAWTPVQVSGGEAPLATDVKASSESEDI
jgi:aryl-alcohol dehydrogenase-like predicted oxidoreductase